MIDVLKRLAELDAKNPSIVKESDQTTLEECGMMDSMGAMSQPHTPASINMTAASGEELSGMLKDIMSLAGMQKVTPDHMGADHEPMALTAEPVKAVGPAASDMEIMRSVIDKMNPEDDEEKTDETQDSIPNDPNGAEPFDADKFAHQENQPGQGDRMDGTMPKGIPAMEQQLMAEYKKFISEN